MRTNLATRSVRTRHHFARVAAGRAAVYRGPDSISTAYRKWSRHVPSPARILDPRTMPYPCWYEHADGSAALSIVKRHVGASLLIRANRYVATSSRENVEKYACARTRTRLYREDVWVGRAMYRPR